jgi:hypothetical protein
MINKEMRDERITRGMLDHYSESKLYFTENQMVGLFLQGSQNYDLDTPESDIDTKLIVVPSFKQIALAKQPVSTTHVRANNEHTDWKDIRLYIETFRKQNLNFLEILFTDYKMLNKDYEPYWKILECNREGIAHMNQHRAVKSMQHIAKEKYHAMCHPYPSKLEILEKYGYDGKQVHHLLRVEDYIERYIAGEEYGKCLKPTPEKVPRMMDYKALDKIPLKEAKEEAEASLERIDIMAARFCADHEDKEDLYHRQLLEDVSYMIMEAAIKKELL